MRSAINRVDVVGKTENAFRIAVVVLQPNFYRDAVTLGFHVDWLVMQHLLAAIEVLDELGDSAVVFEIRGLRLASFGVRRTLVGERYQQALVEECQFA